MAPAVTKKASRGRPSFIKSAVDFQSGWEMMPTVYPLLSKSRPKRGAAKVAWST